jgi:response regulator RpfG family c-di-GMP phosphodiesterase
MQNEVVRRLLAELDHHAPGERMHAERVAVYATATAYALGVRAEELQAIRYAAQLHDIGKVRVDASLLSKLGTLSDEDIALLRSHSEHAVEVLAEEPSLAPAVPLIRAHHERWDGTGYPDGLEGDEIPLGSRIIAVAETFDVLAHGTPWRSSMDEALALSTIEAASGDAFDPRVVEAFLKVQPVIQPVGEG